MNKTLLQNLINKNYSTYQIAKRLKSSQTNARYWLKKHGLKTNFKSFKDGYLPPTKKERIIENGKTYVVCCQCSTKKELNKDNFYIRKDGRYHVWCKPCGRRKSIERLREYKVACVEYKGGKCQICGYNKYFGALDFHHLDSSKKDFTIAGSNKTLKGLKPELDKCVLLCSNCHRETHAGLVTPSSH